MPQTELALFPHWERAKPYRRSVTEIKAIVRFRDGYRCRECGMTAKQHYKKYRRSLEAHRIIPGGRYTIRGCVTLCKNCHKTKPKSPRGTKNNRIVCRLSADLMQAIEAFRASLEFPPSYGAILETALREFLAKRGFLFAEDDS